MGLVLTASQFNALQARSARRPRSSGRQAVSHGAPAIGALVLGIDPGTRVLGFGAVEWTVSGPKLRSAGVLRTAAKDALPERLGALAGELETLLARLGPAVVVVEQAFAATNVQSALKIGEARGVVLACAVRQGCQVVQYPPAVAKKALVGSGQAHKSQVAGMVRRLLGESASGLALDATDALALALTHLLRGRSASTVPVSFPRASLLSSVGGVKPGCLKK